MKKLTIPSLRRVPTALLRAQETQARFRCGQPAQPVVATVAATVEVELSGEIYGSDGLPLLWPFEPCDADAPLVEDAPVGQGRKPAALAMIEAIAPSIEADVAAVEARERYLFELSRARANYACLLAERERLLKVARSVRDVGQNPTHLLSRVASIENRISELEVQWWLEGLRVGPKEVS